MIVADRLNVDRPIVVHNSIGGTSISMNPFQKSLSLLLLFIFIRYLKANWWKMCFIFWIQLMMMKQSIDDDEWMNGIIVWVCV